MHREGERGRSLLLCTTMADKEMNEKKKKKKGRRRAVKWSRWVGRSHFKTNSLLSKDYTQRKIKIITIILSFLEIISICFVLERKGAEYNTIIIIIFSFVIQICNNVM